MSAIGKLQVEAGATSHLTAQMLAQNQREFQVICLNRQRSHR